MWSQNTTSNPSKNRGYKTTVTTTITTWSCICVVSIQNYIINRQHVIFMHLLGNFTLCWGKHRWACKKYFIMYKVYIRNWNNRNKVVGLFETSASATHVNFNSITQIFVIMYARMKTDFCYFEQLCHIAPN